MHIIIIGAGLGGLACAIASRRFSTHQLSVTILERTPAIQPVGAGIQIPPNAARAMRHLGLLDALVDAGAVALERRVLRRWQDGRVLAATLGREGVLGAFGEMHYVVHRADYQGLLIEEAEKLGVRIVLDVEVVGATFGEGPVVTVRDGRTFTGDVVVGADGLWSTLRPLLLNEPAHPPTETGDLAYRGTFSATQLRSLNSPAIDTLIARSQANNWMGPSGHAVFYPLKSGSEFNLVLLRPDNLPSQTRTAEGELAEMRAWFADWDPRLRQLVDCMPRCLKWKLCHMPELDTWVRGRVVLLGDACHPSLPYQAQGAAQAVEDGCVLGVLLSEFGRSSADNAGAEKLSEVLALYERLRKAKTTMNVRGSADNRRMFHMHDGPEQEERDRVLGETDWDRPSVWQWADPAYQKELLGFDAVQDARRAFRVWIGSTE